MEFGKDGCKVNNVHGTVVVETRKEKNFYLFNVNIRKENANVAKTLNEGATLWHQRLGHLNMASFKKLEKMVSGMNLKEVPLHHVCEACIKGKHQMTRPQVPCVTQNGSKELDLRKWSETWCRSQLPALKGVEGSCWKLQD